MATNYQRGRRKEYALRDWLERQGYVVVRSSASKGPIDLVAIKDGQVLLLQVQTSPYVPNAKRAQLLDCANRAGLPIVLAYPIGRGHWHLAPIASPKTTPKPWGAQQGNKG